MELITEYTLELLTEKSVNITVKKYILIDGVKTKVGDTTSCCYNNCEYDRRELSSILPENYFNAVIDVWGDEPIIPNPEEGLHVQ